MKTKLVLLAALLVAAFVVLPTFTGAQAADIKADYERSLALTARLQNVIHNVAEALNWLPGTEKFWYRRSVKGGNDFVLVDAVAATKAPAFDHTKLAASMSTANKATYTAITLPFSTFTFVDNQQAIEFQIGGAGGGRGGAGRGGAGAAPVPGAPPVPRWHCTLTDYVCTSSTPPATPAAAGAGQGRGGRGAGGGGGAGEAGVAADVPTSRASKDGKSEAYIENFNIFVRPVSTNGRVAPGTALTWDGSEGDAYRLQSIVWSPDSKKIAAFRVKPGYQRMVTHVQSSPTDQLQPKTSQQYYQKPGDVVDLQQPVLIDVAARKATLVDNALFPNAYSNGRLQDNAQGNVQANSWRRDSRAFTFEYNQRGHQVFRVIEVDATTGKARTVIEETSKTFVDYRMVAANAGLSDAGRQYRFDVADGKEVIWMSERDGWAHLYLYDGVTGQVKNQITKGNWAVHSVERVDEQARQIWFTANGTDAGKDPYFINYFRINFDGTGLTRYTTADGMHSIPAAAWSSDWQYYVDRYSRVDQPEVSELHRTSDQSLVMTLEKADITDLLVTGWKMPEVFTAKGRDGTTDIWGIIIRPTNFDPAKKYPVIENIYAGPQGSFVPKTFSTQTGMLTLAELGFIVVQVDGMGTANRSKAFHDVAWKNLEDAGFPDRILWHKAIAAKYPYYDITRVGIYGTSAGGQNSLGGLLFHPEFYKVAVSNSGCHDNRMDKIWWNELWMGWPIGPEYAASSNVDNAKNLKGRLMLVVAELDTNVDPSSTMQVVNALVKASKEFELVVVPGADHGAASPITVRKRNDWFVKNLLGLNPPNWNEVAVAAAPGPGGAGSGLDEDVTAWIASENWGSRQVG
jgi:dipeptidyl aminopeptidase/acylaminoacyl peptidase